MIVSQEISERLRNFAGNCDGKHEIPNHREWAIYKLGAEDRDILVTCKEGAIIIFENGATETLGISEDKAREILENALVELL